MIGFRERMKLITFMFQVKPALEAVRLCHDSVDKEATAETLRDLPGSNNSRIGREIWFLNAHIFVHTDGEPYLRTRAFLVIGTYWLILTVLIIIHCIRMTKFSAPPPPNLPIKPLIHSEGFKTYIAPSRLSIVNVLAPNDSDHGSIHPSGCRIRCSVLCSVVTRYTLQAFALSDAEHPPRNIHSDILCCYISAMVSYNCSFII